MASDDTQKNPVKAAECMNRLIIGIAITIAANVALLLTLPMLDPQDAEPVAGIARIFGILLLAFVFGNAWGLSTAVGWPGFGSLLLLLPLINLVYLVLLIRAGRRIIISSGGEVGFLGVSGQSIQMMIDQQSGVATSEV